MVSESLLYIERKKGEEVEMAAYVFWKCQYLIQGAKPIFIRIRMNTLEKLCSCKMFCCEIFLDFFLSLWFVSQESCIVQVVEMNSDVTLSEF